MSHVIKSCRIWVMSYVSESCLKLGVIFSQYISVGGYCAGGTSKCALPPPRRSRQVQISQKSALGPLCIVNWVAGWLLRISMEQQWPYTLLLPDDSGVLQGRVWGWRGYCTATHHIDSHCNTLQHNREGVSWNTADASILHCNTLQHTSTHCDTLQHTATRCNTIEREWCSKHCWHQCRQWCSRHSTARLDAPCASIPPHTPTPLSWQGVYTYMNI